MKITPQSISRFAARYRIILAVIFLATTIGFTAYQVSRVFSVIPDETYLATQKEQQQQIRIQRNSKTLEALRQLRSAGDITPHFETGKKDPFSL